MNLNEVLLEKKTPDGTYVAVKLSKDTCNLIKKMIKELNIPNPLPREKMHTTLIYSRKHFKYEAIGKIDPPWKGTPTKFEIWDTRDAKKSKALVLTYDSEAMVKEHERIMEEYDATYDFDEFQPHVTLSYNIGDLEIKTPDNLLEMIPEIEIVEQYTTDLVLDWQNKD